MERQPVNSYGLATILIPVGLVLYLACFAYDFARTWTDIAEGLKFGLVHSVLLSFVYLVIFVPLICLLLFATRNRPISIWARSTVCLLPLLLICGYSAFIWITDPITDRSCFESTMGFAMPVSAKSILSDRFGGGLTDVSDIYYFEADANEVREMLKQKAFEPIDSEPISTPTGWPDPKKWNGIHTYRYDDMSWCYTIQIDGEWSQVMVSAFCL
ncbi:MAG: hypothetical protein AAF497_19050 [Planctomycetota bacterium]